MAFRIKFLHRDNRYLILLLSLMATVTLPAFSLLIAGDDISDFIFATCFTGIVLAGFIWTASESKLQRIIGTPLGLLALVGLWIKTILTDDTTLEIADTVLSLCFFNFLAFTLLRNIFRSKEVNLGIIFGSVAGYVTIGILGGLWMNLVDLLQPYSFHPEIAKLNSYDYFYFSFVTMTTVGFGDILPQSPPAKSVIIFLSLIGQLYLTILVAVLVGQFLAKRQDQSE